MEENILNKIKKYGVLLLVAAILMPTGLLAYAQESTSSTVGVELDSTVGVELEASDTVEPTDPIIPDPGDDGGQTDDTSPLRIDRVSTLDFGEITLTGNRQTISLRDRRPTARPNIQVSDFRGTGTGWNLQVETAGFFDEERALRGATLSFEYTGLVEHDGDNLSYPPTAQEVILSAGSGASTMMSAATEAGMGTWAYEFGDVVISIPAESLIGDYTATLNWTLSDAPNGIN